MSHLADQLGQSPLWCLLTFAQATPLWVMQCLTFEARNNVQYCALHVRVHSALCKLHTVHAIT